MSNCSDPRCYQHGRHAGAIAAKVRKDIKQYGWSVVGMLGAPSFAYTVGMTERSWPELYFPVDVVGTEESLNKAKALLNAVGQKLVELGEAPRHQTVVVFTDGYGEKWTCLLETRLHTSPLEVARRTYGKRFRVLEVALVD